MLNTVTVLAIGLALVLMVFAPLYMNLFQFTPEKAALTVHMTRIMSPLLLFAGGMTLFQSFLNARKSFIGPQLVGMPLSLCIMLGCILFADKLGVDVLAYATVLGVGLQLLVLVPFIFRKFKYSWVLNWRDPRMKRMFKLMIPALISVASIELNTFVDRLVASGLGDGPISAIHFSNKLNNFIIGTISVSIVTVLYSHLSSLSAKKDMDGLRRESMPGFRLLFCVLAPTVVVAVVSARDIVQIAFERGVFGEAATDITSYAFMFYAPCILAVGLRDICTRTSFSMGNTRTPTINGVISMGVNVVLNLILSRFMGVGGIALATSIAMFFTAFLMLMSLRKRLGNLGFRAVIPQYLRLFAALAVQALVVLVMDKLLIHWSALPRFICVGGVSLLVYAGVGYLLKMDTIVLVLERGWGMVSRIFKRILHRPA